MDLSLDLKHVTSLLAILSLVKVYTPQMGTDPSNLTK